MRYLNSRIQSCYCAPMIWVFAPKNCETEVAAHSDTALIMGLILERYPKRQPYERDAVDGASAGACPLPVRAACRRRDAVALDVVMPRCRATSDRAYERAADAFLIGSISSFAENGFVRNATHSDASAASRTVRVSFPVM